MMHVILRSVALSFSLFLFAETLLSQATTQVVRSYLQKIALGEIDVVRKALPDLLIQYPDDPGIMFVHASLVEDAVKALPLYHKIVNSYPAGEWGDDAQWRIVQIYALANDTLRARKELASFREKYPTSPFLLYAVETVKMTVGMEGGSATVRQHSIAQSQTQKTPAPKTETTPAVAPKKTFFEEKPSSASITERSPEPDRPSSGASTAATGEDSYTLQVGVYSTREAATDVLATFAKLRIRCDIIEKTSADGSIRYAVTVGEYDSRDSAENARPRVATICRCDPFVLKK